MRWGTVEGGGGGDGGGGSGKGFGVVAAAREQGRVRGFVLDRHPY